MPSDIEILWVTHLVYVQPVSWEAMEWLQVVMPQKYRWDMRLVSHEDLEGLAEGARKRHLTIGGVSMPSRESDYYDW